MFKIQEFSWEGEAYVDFKTSFSSLLKCRILTGMSEEEDISNE